MNQALERLSIALVVIASALPLTGCVDQRPIIAVVGDMNNARGDFGHHFADGAATALAGEGVRIVYLDDKDLPATATTKAMGIVQDPRLLLVIGHSASATTAAATAVYARAGIPLIAPIATMDDLFPLGALPSEPTVFRLPPPNRYQASAIVKHLKSKPIEHVVVIYSEDRGYSSSMERQLEAKWASPNSFASIDLTTADLTADQTIDDHELANSIKAELNRFYDGTRRGPAAVVVATYYREAIAAFRAIRQVKLEVPDLSAIGTDGVLHPELGPPLREILLGAELVFVGPSWQAFDPGGVIFDRYRVIHQRDGHPQREDQPSMYDAMWPSFIEYGYVAGSVAKAAIAEASNSGALTKNKIMAVLRTKSFTTDSPAFQRVEFERSARAALMEPKEYVITVHAVSAAPAARRLDALWLRQVASYSAKDLR